MTPGFGKWRAAWWQYWKMLEKMAEFFEARLKGYDVHMLTEIEGAGEFYPFTADLLPASPGCRILDLGCGTGLELEYYFRRCPDARVTGIDLSEGMLGALKEKFPDKALTLIRGSYFDTELGREIFDGAVSVESLHHFTEAEKFPLYRRLCGALKPGSSFILTDYFAPNQDYQDFYRGELLRLKAMQGIPEEEFYHYDTPLTVDNETEVLLAAGFCHVECLGQWGCTCTLRATKYKEKDHAL